MIDKSKRYLRTMYALDSLPTLKGKQLFFDSMADMLVTRAKEIPNDVFVYYYDQVITFAQINERTNRVANYLKDKGVKKGDVVSVMVQNSPEVYYTMFGAQKIGAVAGAINYMLKAPEIAYVLNDSKPKVAFVGSDFMTDFAKGREIAEHKPIVVEVVTDIKHDAKIAEQPLTDILAKYPADEAVVPQALDDPFMLLYSSGTTGYPKGILLSNRGQLSVNKDMARFRMNEPGDKFMIVAPMFHTNPLCVWTYPYLYMGLSLVIRTRYSPEDYWGPVIDYGVNVIWGVPAMYQYLLYNMDTSKIDKAKLKVRYAFAGGAPVPVEMIRDFKEQFNITVIDGYGLTEVTGVSTVSFNQPLKPGSPGTAFYEQQIEIMDDDNNILPYGEKGEICIKGDAVMIGYLNKPEATAETILDGWLHTGDMGYMDEEGYMYISGRKKEMINRGGENIYPREIEVPLEGHPMVAEVAVIGVPDPALGERVKACIIPKKPGSMTEQEVKDYLKQRIAKYKVPEFVEFMTDFPRNASGKILKQELKSMHK